VFDRGSEAFALERLLVVSWASGSKMALFNIRSVTGIPMTLASKGLKFLGGAITAVQVTKALATAQKEYNSCMASN
jgi:hypothetical protein